MIAQSRDFKTIVFFGSGFSQFKFIKDEFAAYPSVRVFQSKIADEIGQILSQSSVTAILVRDIKHIKELAQENVLSMKAAGVRFYFLNDGAKLTREEMEKLSVMKITTLSSLSDLELRNKLEMFILNKLRLNDRGPSEKDAEEEEDSAPKQSYFTYFKKVKEQWVIYVSTHEQEKEIETLFGKSWTVYCMDLLSQADEYAEVQENPEFCGDYMSIIYPHRHSDETRGLSVMHVKKDAIFAETYMRALTFLSKI